MRKFGVAAVIAGSLVATAATAGDPRVGYSYSGSFTAIGDAPNMAWTTGLNGAITPIYTPGVANVLISFTDNRGFSVTNAPGTLYISGAFFSAAGLAAPFASFNFSFDFAGPGGGGFDVDCPLFGGGNLGGGGCGAGPNSIALGNGVTFTVTPPPTETFVINPSGAYPFTLAGSGQVNGFFSGFGVPEPSTWTLMIAGFGAAGAALRRRKLQSV